MRVGPGQMRAHMLFAPGQLELCEVPVPSPSPGEVVVRVRTALTCGTDLKTYRRGHPKFAMPMRFGHEFAGEVAAVGRGVTSVREGDAVMAVPTAPCGACYYCEREQENLCPEVMPTMVHGAYAEYVALPERIVRRNLFVKPPELPFAEAALLEPLACVVHSHETLPVRVDDTVVILGAGAFALLHALYLRHRGAGRIVVVARKPSRAAHAQALGVEVVAGDALAVAADVAALTDGRGADVVIEATGQVAVWQAAPALARRGGHVMLFGGCPAGSTIEIDTGRLHYDEVTLSSPFHLTPRSARRAWELLSAGTLGAAALVSGRYSLEELPTALARLQRGEGAKYAIEP